MSPAWISLGKHIIFRTSILIIFYIFLLQACWTKALKAGSKNFKKTRKDPTAHVKLYTYLMSENIWRLLIGKFSCCVASFVLCLPIVCEKYLTKAFLCEPCVISFVVLFSTSMACVYLFMGTFPSIFLQEYSRCALFCGHGCSLSLLNLISKNLVGENIYDH